MTRIRQAGPPVLIVSLIAGVIGYVLGCTSEQRATDSQAHAAQAEQVAQAAAGAPSEGNGNQNSTDHAVASVKAIVDRDVYYPGTEDLGPDEMRVIACGTGMPNARPKQAPPAGWSN